MLSPHFNEEVFVEEVSGIEFHKTIGIEVHAISIDEGKLSGIQSALRKNILIPYDKETRDFVNGNNFAKVEKPAPEKVEVEVKEEVTEPVKEEIKKEAPKKTTRKRTAPAKKESE